ncbi:MAG TPA: alpha/beta hydrolase [Steroidobacter sp.]|uniref:alpha/beta fold hydrolase n=1 Tax=Steroidobacter sp. TaxID=1978227 RepID=UPI002EDA3BC2
MKSVLSLIVCALLSGMPVCGAWARDGAATAPTRYVEVGGTRTAYRSIGRGSPIILANRLRGTLDTWDPLFLDELARKHTVITVDYPGIGYSAGELPDDLHVVARFIDDFARALDLEKYAILGWSWGGLAAQVLLLDQPDRVTHAILIGTNPPGPVPMPTQQAFLERATKPVNDLADEQVLFFEPKSPRSLVSASASHERIYARSGVVDRIPAKMETLQIYFRAALAFRADSGDARQKLIVAPTPILIICGDNDISAPAPNWFPLVGQIRNAQLLIYPESGHAPQFQYPELSAAYIANFLARPSR